MVLAVLDADRSAFLETNEFIDSALKKECEKEKMTADEVNFLLLNLQKKLVWFDDHRWSRKNLKI